MANLVRLLKYSERNFISHRNRRTCTTSYWKHLTIYLKLVIRYPTHCIGLRILSKKFHLYSTEALPTSTSQVPRPTYQAQAMSENLTKRSSLFFAEGNRFDFCFHSSSVSTDTSQFHVAPSRSSGSISSFYKNSESILVPAFQPGFDPNRRCHFSDLPVPR